MRRMRRVAQCGVEKGKAEHSIVGAGANRDAPRVRTAENIPTVPRNHSDDLAIGHLTDTLAAPSPRSLRSYQSLAPTGRCSGIWTLAELSALPKRSQGDNWLGGS